MSAAESGPTKGAVRAWLGLLAVALFVVCLTSPPNLMGNEWRVAAYALDVVQNGRWLVQTDTDGTIAGKPPLLAWLVALAVFPTGRVSQVALYWPSAFATVLTAWAVLEMGWSRFGWRAGFLGAATYLVSWLAFDQMRTARYDGLLACAVTLGAWAAWLGWLRGRGWIRFWTAVAIGTLIKGPLAVVLSAAGLLAALWERWSGTVQPIRGAHGPGLAVFLGLTGGWLLLAYLEIGPTIIHRLFEQELAGHAVGKGRETSLALTGVRWALREFLLVFVPWSVLAFAAVWRAVRRPAEDPDERRFERFTIVWLLVGLAVFSMAGHHRVRLLYPVVPAAALLAGRELSRWGGRLSPRVLLGWSAGVAVAALVAAIVLGQVGMRSNRDMQASVATRDFARTLEALGPGEFPLTYLDRARPLQVWLSTRRLRASVDQVAHLMRGEAAAFVVVERIDPALRRALGDQPVHELFRWPAAGEPHGMVISNHPRLEWPERTALVLDGIRVEMNRARLQKVTGEELVFLAEPGRSTVTVANVSPAQRTVRLRFTSPKTADFVADRRLPPQASWRERWGS